MIDDLWLGRDNTMPPTKLKSFEPKLSLREITSKSVGGRAKGRGFFYDLVPEVKKSVLVSATSDGQVQALDKNTMALKWRQYYPGAISAGPSVSGSVVALCTTDAKLVVLNAKTGQMLWQKPLANQSLAKPLISDDAIFVKTVDGHLYAFNKKTGQRNWRSEHRLPEVVLRADSSPILLGGTILAGFADGEIIGFNRYNGNVLWSRQIVKSHGVSDAERMVDIATTPVVDDSALYVSSFQGKIAALSLNGMHPMWTHKMSTFLRMSASKNTIYLVDANSVLWALNRKNGQVLWRQKALEYRGLSAPVVGKNHLFIGDSQGYLHVLSAQSGQVVARVKTGRAALLTPVVNQDRVFTLNQQGMLKVYKVG